jgi:hypothetical protein
VVEEAGDADAAALAEGTACSPASTCAAARFALASWLAIGGAAAGGDADNENAGGEAAASMISFRHVGD